MPALTIRNIDETLKRKLRVRAAHNGRSMEEEARVVLREALDTDSEPDFNLAERIHARFAKLGGIDLPVLPRGPMREPPSFED